MWQGEPAPKIRVDYMLANRPFLDLSLASPSGELSGDLTGDLSDELRAEVLVNAETAVLSDHYPIRVTWMHHSSIPGAGSSGA